MRKINLCIFICILCCAFSFAQLGPEDETIVIKTEFETTDFHESFYIGGDNIYTPITSYKGSIYFIWIDSSRRPKLGKIKNGIVTTQFLDKNEDDPYIIREDGHHKFSLGIDKQGYIHIIGDLHNYGTSTTDSSYVERYRLKYNLYWRSEQPENIHSFIFQGGDQSKVTPGYGFSYPSFHSDMNGELYVRHRAKIGPWGHYDGEMGWIASRYNMETKQWIELGKIPASDTFTEQYSPTNKAIFWEDNGIGSQTNKNWYQYFGGDMRFDFNNRWHLTTAINNNNDIEKNTDIIYAYSDNGGTSFNKVDGSNIENLPIRADLGTNQGTIVTNLNEAPEGFIFSSSICFNKEGSPMVSYTKVDSTALYKMDIRKYKYWKLTTKQWSLEKSYPVGGFMRHTTTLDANGIINYIGPDINGNIIRDFGLNESIDNSKWKNTNGFISGIDHRAVREKNALRFFHFNPKDSIKKLKIVTLEGIPNTSPISEEWTQTTIGQTSGETSMFHDIYQLKSTGKFQEDLSGNFVHQEIEGDFEFQARVINVNYMSDDSFAGLLVRDSNNENDSFFGIASTSYNGVKTISKDHLQETKTSVLEGYEPSEWLKIKRTGSLLESFRSDNGKIWTKLESKEINMNTIVSCGLISGSGNLEQVGHARVDHVSIKRTNIAAHYNFNNNINDSSGNDIHGTNFNELFFENESNEQQVLNLKGDTPRPTITKDELLKLQNLTLTAWIKPQDINNDLKGIIQSPFSNGTQSGWRLTSYKDVLTATLATNNSIKSVSTPGIKPLEWNHIALSYNHQSLKIYLNGVLSDSIHHSGDIIYNLQNNIEIGNAEGTQKFNGLLDELKIRDIGISSKQIKQEYLDQKDNYIIVDTISQTALIAHYKLNATINDSSGNNLHGNNINQLIFKEENTIQALDIENNNMHAIIEKNELLKLNKLTISTWIKPQIIDNNLRGLIQSAYGDGWYSGWNLNLYKDVLTVTIVTDNESKTASITGLKAEEWNHVAFSYDGNSIKIYLNGIDNSSIPLSGNIIYNLQNDMEIGNANNTLKFNGLMDEIKIFNYSLSNIDIEQEYLNLKETYLPSPVETSSTSSLIAYYNFNNTGLDESGNNLHINNENQLIFNLETDEHTLDLKNNNPNPIIAKNELLKPQKLTFSAWIKPESFNNDLKGIAQSAFADGWNSGWQLTSYKDILTATIVSENEKRSASITGFISEEWNHVAFTYDQNFLKIYLNGIPTADSTPLTGNIIYNLENDMEIGNCPGTVKYSGLMDEVKLFDYSLSDSEIEQEFVSKKDIYQPSDTINTLYDSHTEIAISIYPIPVIDFINIEYSNYIEIDRIEILDLIGNHIRNIQLINQHTIIDLSDLAPNIYYFKIIKNTGETHIKRFIVE